MIPRDKEADIARLARAEKWPVGTIAHQLGVHHSVVRRVLGQLGVLEAHLQRPSIADPYVPFIKATLEKYPKLHASRLYEMVKERGYPGACDHFRSIVGRYRPSPPAEAPTYAYGLCEGTKRRWTGEASASSTSMEDLASSTPS